MSAAASCRGAAEKESPPCLQCRSDTPNPGVETEASCGRHTETSLRHKRLLAGTATADDMTFTRNLIVVERAVERARIHKLNESLLSLPAKSAESAGKDDVAAARRTGQKKRTREEVEVEKDEVEGEEEKKERIRHNTNLLRVLARKELMDLARLNSVSPTESKALIVEALACVLDIRAAHVLGKAVFGTHLQSLLGPHSCGTNSRRSTRTKPTASLSFCNHFTTTRSMLLLEILLVILRQTLTLLLPRLQLLMATYEFSLMATRAVTIATFTWGRAGRGPGSGLPHSPVVRVGARASAGQSPVVRVEAIPITPGRGTP